VLWDTGTEGDYGADAVMQADGNLVVYRGSSAAWNSQTEGNAGAYLTLQNDANLVVYQGATPLRDRLTGLLGGGSGPTAAETAAVNWATGQLGSTGWNNLCLSFVQTAYSDAGINIKDDTSGVTWNNDTYPQDVWGHFTTGTTGTGAPPYGAVVFFLVNPQQHPISDSHVVIMSSGGEMISSNDAFNETDVHQETLTQEQSSGAWASC
jgi:hypothetical protein